MENQPAPEFGKRRPAKAAEAATEPVKRSRHVALLLMGTLAVGGSAYALMPRENCEPNGAGVAGTSLPQTGTACRPPGSSSGGGHGGSWSRSNFFGSEASSSRSSSSTTDEPGSGEAARGGFGSFARGFAALFSGGG